MLYIQKQIQFWETDTPLPASYKVGTTEEEYNDGAYLLLDTEQEQFHTDHPEASPLECWNKAFTPEPEPTPEEKLWQARDKKRQEVYDMDIYHYYIDEKDAYVGDTLRMKDKCNRQSEVEVNGTTYPAKLLSVALDEMADYSEQCASVTNTLLTAIDAAETAEAVEAIEVTGYPEVVHTTSEMLQAKADEAARKSPEAQAVTFARAMVNSVSLSANKALEMQVLFPVWGEEGAEFGKQVPVGFRFRYGELLYEVIQAHALQADWIPGTDETKAIYGLVSGSTGEHAGTLEDPIPYERNMVLYKGKYYTQFGETYLCTRDSIVGYDVDLADPGLASLLEKVE